MDNVEIGSIRIEDHLPAVFQDAEVRRKSEGSLSEFQSRHNGELPLKFRIEEFCFKRDDQICTVDSANKYIAWDGKNLDLARDIFLSIKPTELPLVLRSHPVEFSAESPTVEIKSPDDLESLQRHLGNQDHPSTVWEQFFAKLDLDNTVIQLIKNPYLQSGLFLCRATFIYDSELRSKIERYTARSPQYLHGEYFSLGNTPETFACFRILPLGESTREKKGRLGSVFTYNPKTEKFYAKEGFPLEAKWHMQEEFSGKGGRIVMGRTIDLATGITTLHYDSGPSKHNSLDSVFLSGPDLEFIQEVLSWQLPRIFAFEEEIRRQEWIPQGLSNTHQFVIFPPQELGKNRIDTQYFDFRPHPTLEEMEKLAKEKKKNLGSMTTEDKLTFFF